jgi:hypothetical protein
MPNDEDADVAVGDFATLNQRVSEAQRAAVGAERDAAATADAGADAGGMEQERQQPQEAAAAATASDDGAAAAAQQGGGGPAASSGASDLAPGVDSDLRQIADAARAGGEGLLVMLGGLMADLTSKVNIGGSGAGDAAGGDATAGAASSGRDAHETVKEGDAFVRRPDAGEEGIGATLQRGWEDLKRGGSKAPWVDAQV